MSGHHALFYTHSEDLVENTFKNMFRKELPGPADGAVPGKFFVYVMIQKEEDVQSQGTMFNEFSVTYDIFQITDEANFKEYNWINGLLATFPIILFSMLVKKTKV